MIATASPTVPPPVGEQPLRALRVIERCRELAWITDVPGETTRTFLSPATREAHTLLTRWMQAAGLNVRTDAAGNLRGLRAASTAQAPRVLIGSHIDTVPNAGPFDGVLGVLLGLALVEELGPSTAFPFTIELVAFSEEEGVRFAKPFLGSLALVGRLDAAALALKDRDGVDVAAAMRAFGLDPAGLPSAVVDPTTAAYLEFHIEQGPVLESEGLALAVVDAIVGQTRLSLTFTGHANHAGTTPMGHLRHDALAAAAAWIAEVERYAAGTTGLVATVGQIDVPRSAANIIPGQVATTLDVRHADDQVRATAVRHLVEFARRSGAVRGVDVSDTTTLDQPAITMNATLVPLLADAVSRITGSPARVMPSGAGHDAMIVARRIPSAMLFLRSPGGLSHHPDESVLAEDVETALAAGLEFLRGLSDDSTILENLTRARQEDQNA